MIHDLIAVYQFFAAIYVTLCFDVVFKNFAWDKNVVEKVMQGFESSGKLNSKEEDKGRIERLLDSKYEAFYTHSRSFACVYLLYSITLLFVSSCSYWFVDNPYRLFLVHNLTVWLIYYVTIMLLCFIFFRKQIFSSFSIISVVVLIGVFLTCEHYYFLMLNLDKTSVQEMSSDECQDIIVGCLSFLVLLLPLVYYFLHGKFFNLYNWK